MAGFCKPELIVIAGPTASGKTACAVELCRRIGGEVVSADSMQVYRGMDILTAMPAPDEMRGIPHHMLGIADPSQKFTAAMYRDRAKAVIGEILARGRRPVVCGGTGLYIDALTKPLSFSEQSDERLHAELFALADEPGGRRKLHDMLAEVDPESAARLHENDVRRVVRALEIYRLTGIPQSAQVRQDARGEGDYDRPGTGPGRLSYRLCATLCSVRCLNRPHLTQQKTVTSGSLFFCCLFSLIIAPVLGDELGPATSFF